MAKHPHPQAVETYKDGKLTRFGMEQALAAGSSVLYQGRTISNVADLPNDADLAQTPEEKAAAADDLDAQIQRLQAQKAALAEKPDSKSDHKSDKK